MKEIKKVIIEAVQDSIDLTDNQVSISVLNILLDQQLPEQLALYGVSQQRELLEAYQHFIDWNEEHDRKADTLQRIDAFIASNCG